MNNENLDEQIKKAYDEIEKQEEKLKAEIKKLADKKKPLRSYLREAGILDVPTRNRQPQKVQVVE